LHAHPRRVGSARRPSRMAILRARELVLQNFKSYEGRVHVGPFKKFTCIVGPNGAGKSNLVEAISFVLGVAARQLRGEQLRNLIHCKEGESRDAGLRTAFVELICECRFDGVASNAEDAAEVVFRREILMGGDQTRFSVNGEAMTQADYFARLEGFNILPKARNFLVSQGDLEAASWRQGRELTKLFEQVSGSAEFRAEYEQLEAEKLAKEDNARLLYVRRRNAVCEKKRVKEQKDEADRYRAIEAELKECQRQFCLFRLYCVRCQIQEIKRLIGEQLRKRTDVDGDASLRMKRASDAEAERAKAHLAAAAAEKKIAEAEGRLESASASEDAAKIETLRARLEELKSGAERSAKRMRQLKEQVEQLQQERLGIDTEAKRLEDEAMAHAVAFTAGQRKEFEQKQQKVERLTAHVSLRVQELEARIKQAAEDRGRAERDAREVTTRRNHLRQRVSDLVDAQEDGRAAKQRDEQAALDRAQQLRVMQSRSQEYEKERGTLHAEREKVIREVQDITATDRQIQQEQKLAQTIQELVQSVPAVHGRVLNLFSVPSDRHTIAMNVALGGYLNAVVTETADGARRCIRYLKDRMLPALTFLPLDSMRGQAPDSRLVELLGGKSGLRTALSCVKFSRQFERSFQFLLGDVVIAESLDEARRFVFEDLADKGIGCRVVTVHGETISRDGNMAFNADASKKDVTRFELANLGVKKTRLEAIDRRIQELHTMEAMAADTEAFKAEVMRAEARATAAKQQLEQTDTELDLRKRDLDLAQQALNEASTKALRLEEEESALRVEQRGLEEEIGKIVFSHFAALSKEMGVEDIHRLEREARRNAEAARSAVSVLEQKKGIVDAELEMLEQTIVEREARDPAKEAAEVAERLAELERKAAASEEESAEAALAALRAALQDLQQEERVKEKVAGELARESREAKQRLNEVDRKVAGLNSEVGALQDVRLDILRKSVLDGIELPLLGGRTWDDLREMVASASSQEGGEDPATVVDLEQLPPEQREAAEAGMAAAELMESEYRERLSKREKDLERLQPNLKADDLLSDAVKQAQGVAQEVADGRAGIDEVTRRFEDVRQRRRDRFMRCFNVVQEEINGVYRQLTGGAGSDGGSAYLDLEDVQDPYKGGVKFTAMPPTKRFSDVSLLSGGERALAAIALLFALQTFQRPPFLILDEVDAHLDLVNIQALARFVAQSACQTIVVSLKDQLYVRSDGLVGVTKDTKAETSVIFTVDLEQFRRLPPAPLPGPAQPAPPPLGDMRRATPPSAARRPGGLRYPSSTESSGKRSAAPEAEGPAAMEE